MYPAETTIDGIAHPTAEHASQYAKATFAGDHAQAQKISDTTNPYTAKQLGKSVYVPAWDARKETVLKEVMTRKFEQSRSLRDELLSTGDNTLVECTADGVCTDRLRYSTLLYDVLRVLHDMTRT